MTDTEQLPWGHTIDDWPLPLEQHEVDEYIDEHPYLEEVDELHVDELNEDYIDTLARNGEWHIFTCYLLGTGIYVWNHVVGGGVVIEEKPSYHMLADCFHSLYEEDSHGQYVGTDSDHDE